MTESKWTPGPWHYRPIKYDDWGYVRGPVASDGSQDFICQAKDVRVSEKEEEEEARWNGTDPWEWNGRLIAAAPDMAEAMQEFIDRCDRGEVRSTKTYNKFKAIMQKARGETQ